MLYNVEIEITTREGVLNPESKTILQALQGHDFQVSQLVMNKKFYLRLDAANMQIAKEQTEQICQDFLANPIIQDYTIQINEA